MKRLLQASLSELRSDSPQRIGGRGFVLATIGLLSIEFMVGVTLSSPVAFPFLFIPILLWAMIFGFRGAIAGSLGAGLVMAVSHSALGSEQTAPYWLSQSSVYIVFGLFVGVLLRRPWVFPVQEPQQYPLTSTSTKITGIYNKVLASLANAVEVRDQHTQGHCRRVADNAMVMGRAIGMAEHELDVLYWGAMLHDLGKIAIPEYVLSKQGRLTDEEFQEIKRHPEYGADLLSSISSDFIEIANVVRAHHERWDSHGYPRGLHGESIPLAARIVTIVDVFEALTSYRPYRSPMPAQEALKFIRNSAGTQFDPSLVPVFESLFYQGYIDYFAVQRGSRTNHSNGGMQERSSDAIVIGE